MKFISVNLLDLCVSAFHYFRIEHRFSLMQLISTDRKLFYNQKISSYNEKQKSKDLDQIVKPF